MAPGPLDTAKEAIPPGKRLPSVTVVDGVQTLPPGVGVGVGDATGVGLDTGVGDATGVGLDTGVGVGVAAPPQLVVVILNVHPPLMLPRSPPKSSTT